MFPYLAWFKSPFVGLWNLGGCWEQCTMKGGKHCISMDWNRANRDHVLLICTKTGSELVIDFQVT